MRFISTRSGEPIWIDNRYEAPKQWLTDGLIQDAEDVNKEGQDIRYNGANTLKDLLKSYRITRSLFMRLK